MVKLNVCFGCSCSAEVLKRLRKLPARYQNSGELSANSDFGMKILDNRSHIAAKTIEGKLNHCSLDESVFHMDGSESAMSGDSKVLIPPLKLPNDVDIRVWCIYHGRYICSCSDYKNPLDFEPKVSRSRNVGREIEVKTLLRKQKHENRNEHSLKTKKEHGS